MRSTFSLLFYINRNKVRSDGTTSVLCRISIDGKNTVRASPATPNNGMPKMQRPQMHGQTTA